MKDGRTRPAHKLEHAVDMDTGAVAGVTVQTMDGGDTASPPVNIRKRMLVHAAAFNLGLLMRRLYRVGTPRGLRGLATVSAALADRASTAVSPDSSPVPPPYRPSGPSGPLLPVIVGSSGRNARRRHQLRPSRR